jgi:hypothetical protein
VHVQKESTLHLILRRQSPRILETEVRGRSVEVSGSGGALRSVTLLVDGVAAATATSDGAGVWQVTIELEPGEHELTAAFTDELGDPLARSPAVRVTVAEPPAAAPPAKEPAPAHAPEVAATRPVLSAATTRGRCVTPAGWLAPRPPRGRRAPFISFRLTAAAVVRYALIRRGGGARGRGKRAKEGERPEPWSATAFAGSGPASSTWRLPLCATGARCRLARTPCGWKRSTPTAALWIRPWSASASAPGAPQLVPELARGLTSSQIEVRH